MPLLRAHLHPAPAAAAGRRFRRTSSGSVVSKATPEDQKAIRASVLDFIAVNSDIYASDIGRINLVDKENNRVGVEVVLNSRLGDLAAVKKIASQLTALSKDPEVTESLTVALPSDSGTITKGFVELLTSTKQEAIIPDLDAANAVPTGPYKCSDNSHGLSVVTQGCLKAGAKDFAGAKYYSMQALDRVVTDALGMPDAVGCVLAGLFADKQLGRALKDIGIVVFEGNPGSGVARGTLVLNLAHPSDYIKVAAKMFGVDPSDVSKCTGTRCHAQVSSSLGALRKRCLLLGRVRFLGAIHPEIALLRCFRVAFLCCVWASC